MTGFLLIDIDGVLNPFFENIWPEQKERLASEGWQHFREPGLPWYWLNPVHGEWLRSTGCTLVWATRWHDWANKLVSPVMCFGRLETIYFDPRREKTYSVTPWARGRRFAWLDDENEDRTDGEQLFIRVTDTEGLTCDQVTQAAQWLSS